MQLKMYVVLFFMYVYHTIVESMNNIINRVAKLFSKPNTDSTLIGPVPNK